MTAYDMIWADQATTTSGEATFFPTDDGTATGRALFSSFDAIQLTGQRNTGLFTAVPFPSIKTVAGDLKSIVVMAAMGTVLGIVGATMLSVPDGTVIHCTIFGRQ